MALSNNKTLCTQIETIKCNYKNLTSDRNGSGGALNTPEIDDEDVGKKRGGGSTCGAGALRANWIPV